MIPAPKFMRAVALAGILAVAALAPLAAQEPFEGADIQRRRQAWFDDQRAYPDAEVDWNRLFRTRQLFMARPGSRGLASLAAASSGSWTPLGPNGFFGVGYWDSGPQMDAGRVDAIALHPTATGTMFVASRSASG